MLMLSSILLTSSQHNTMIRHDDVNPVYLFLLKFSDKTNLVHIDNCKDQCDNLNFKIKITKE